MSSNQVSNIALTAAIVIIGVVAPFCSDMTAYGFWLGFIATMAMVTLFRIRGFGFVEPTYTGLIVILAVIALMPSSVIEMSLAGFLDGIIEAILYYAGIMLTQGILNYGLRMLIRSQVDRK